MSSPVVLRFDRKNPEALRWAKRRSSALVVEVSEKTRNSIRRIMERAFVESLPPVETARLLRSVVGLTEDQAEAVYNLRSAILENPGRLVHAGKMKFRVPATGADADYVASAMKRYASRLLTYRTQNIARTETLTASKEGQRQLWLQAVEQGALDGTEQRKWLTAKSERTCPICSQMHGRLTGLDEPFILPDGTPVMQAQAHPQCRCGEGIVVVSQTRAAALRALGFENVEVREAFDPNQPRDKEGQWTDGGPSFGLEDSSPNFDLNENLRLNNAMSRRAGLLSEDGDDPDVMLVASQRERAAMKQAIKEDLAPRLSAEALSETGVKISDVDEFDPITGEIFTKTLSEAQGDFVRGRLDGWAQTSGDSNPRAIADQESIRRTFNIESASMSHFPQRPSSTNAAQDEFNRAEYNSTQRFLRENGIEHVSVYRGVHSVNLQEGVQDVMMQPASSWSTSLEMASQFATGGSSGSGYILEARFPRRRVLSTAVTGRGCLIEAEVLILGGPTKVKVTVS